MEEILEIYRKNLQNFGDSMGIILVSKWVKENLKLDFGDEIILSLIKREDSYEIRLTAPKKEEL